MAIENTFSIIKPDATRRNLTGSINSYFEKNGLANYRTKTDFANPRTG